MYITTVVVDNNRAARAYAKGLADMESNWGRLIEIAKAKDAETEEKIRRIKEEDRKNREKEEEEDINKKENWNSILDEYERKLSDWKERLFFKGEKPRMPYPEATHRMTNRVLYYELQIVLANRGYCEKTLKSVKQELSDLYNLASAAIQPFSMDEWAVRKMIKWEDGTRIQELVEQTGQIPMRIINLPAFWG